MRRAAGKMATGLLRTLTGPALAGRALAGSAFTGPASAGRAWRTLLVVALLLAVPALAWSQGLGAGAGGRRVALVVGNGAYRSVDRLANPANDAKLMADTLRGAGFTLIGGGPQIDLDKNRFNAAVQQFGRALAGADVALFYYSGHGMQVGGVNWLVPVDANPTGPRDLDFQMLDASLVLRQMENAGTKLNLLLLDACRNNPFAFRGVRGAQGGLAEMHAPEGTLISYATQPGNVAADGTASNSPYTTALADAIRRPGADVFQVFNQVGLSVKQATGGEQQPWLASSPISGSFYFFTGPVTIVAPPPPPVSPDTAFWQAIADSSDPADFETYLRRFPRGAFAAPARQRLAGLGGTRFDGTWTATIACDPTPDGVRGWSATFPASVAGGLLHGERGVSGTPSSFTIEGMIRPDGTALLKTVGRTGNPAYNVNREQEGVAYRYPVEATFDGTHGTGHRLGQRSCSLFFDRN